MSRIQLSAIVSAVAMTAVLAGCPDPARTPRAEPATGQTGQGGVQLPGQPDDVIATVGEEKITLGQIDKEIQGEMKQAEMQYRTAIHDLREQAVERYIAEKLLKEEAQRRGLEGPEALVQQEVEEGTPAPTEQEVQRFYEENKARMGGAELAQVKDRVEQFLVSQKKREKFTQLMEQLRSQANVSVNLPQPRLEVAAVGPSKGPENAPVTIVEFSDFQCPYCSRALPVLEQIEQKYGDKVRVVFRDFPLPFHTEARKAAEAAECAAAQGKFWEMHDTLFQNQDKLKPEGLKELAQGIEGLDQQQFTECLDSGRMAANIDEDMEAGKALGVQGTPAFFVNGIMISGAQPFEAFEQIIDRELAAAGVEVEQTAPQQDAPQQGGETGSEG